MENKSGNPLEKKENVMVEADNPLEENNGNVIVYEEEVSLLIHKGPIPDAETFYRLQQIDPSFPGTIIKMAVQSSDAEIRKIDAEIKRKEEKSKLKERKLKLEARGQLFIFILALILIGVSVFLVLKGYGLIAIVPFLGGISPIITTVINNLAKK